VEVLAHYQLTGEGALGALGDDDVLSLLRLPGPFGPHGEHVLLNGEVDRGGVYPGEVEVDDEAVTVAVGVHRHRGLMGRAGLLGEQLGEAVHLPVRVEAHEHGRSLPFSRTTRGGARRAWLLVNHRRRGPSLATIPATRGDLAARIGCPRASSRPAH